MSIETRPQELRTLQVLAACPVEDCTGTIKDCKNLFVNFQLKIKHSDDFKLACDEENNECLTLNVGDALSRFINEKKVQGKIQEKYVSVLGKQPTLFDIKNAIRDAIQKQSCHKSRPEVFKENMTFRFENDQIEDEFELKDLKTCSDNRLIVEIEHQIRESKISWLEIVGILLVAILLVVVLI